MEKITIKFTPLEDYFFGQENKDKNGDANYFLKSNRLPQPTTILGAIRFWLLSATENFENGKIKDKGKAEKIIGQKSFVLNGDFSFGIISQISNLFLLDKNNNKYIPAPFWLDENEKEFDWDDSLKAPLLPTFNAKNGISEIFSNGSSTKGAYEIFNEKTSTHNRKNNREEDGKDSYYKTQTYTLLDGFSFGVQVDLNEAINELKNIAPQYFKIGGENKLFKIEIIGDKLKTDEEILSQYSNSKFPKLIFTSDSFIENLDKNDYLYGIIQAKNFRSLYAEVAQINNYSALSETKESMNKSKLFQLIQAGSVLYFKDDNEANSFIGKYLIKENLSNAGFNQYILLKAKNQ